ncbi:MAG: HD-GYP domain-containing protein [Halanaerobiaceae bacterium]
MIIKDIKKDSVVSMLEKIIWKKNYETEEHAKRMKRLSLKLGKKAGLSETSLKKLVLLAVLHDLGKIVIPDRILLKPDSLNREEWYKIKQHTIYGYNIALSYPETREIAEGILYHHEWWDGSGYPEGLKGKEIPLISRIISIVDAYDVMTHDRSYKEPLSKARAREELKDYAGIQFDPALVPIFLNLI